MKTSKKRVRITQRDMELFRWINSFRYVQAQHVFKKFQVSQNFYRRLRLLVENEFLIYEAIFRGMPGHYHCSRKATDAAQDELSPPRTVDLATYHHDIILTDLALEMEHRTGGQWLAERRLRGASNEEGLRKYNYHFPDGLLILDNGGKKYRIAIELEHLNRKSKKRLAKIIEGYLDGGFSSVGRVNQVAYFCCSQAIQQKVTDVVKSLGADRLVEVHLLDDILSLPERGEKEA
jgi:hypothetical protein